MSNLSKFSFHKRKTALQPTRSSNCQDVDSAIADMRIKIGFLDAKVDHIIDRMQAMEKRIEEEFKAEKTGLGRQQDSPKTRYKFIRVESVSRSEKGDNEEDSPKTPVGSKRILY